MMCWIKFVDLDANVEVFLFTMHFDPSMR